MYFLANCLKKVKSTDLFSICVLAHVTQKMKKYVLLPRDEIRRALDKENIKFFLFRFKSITIKYLWN